MLSRQSRDIIMMAAGKQPMIIALFSKRKKTQGNSSVMIQVDSDSNDEAEHEERFSGKLLMQLSHAKSIN